MATMLSFKKVSKNFGNIKALDDVSFDIKPAEFVFLIGPSGAGKTTIMRLILRELLPSKGEIIFDGHKLSELKKGDIPQIRRKIGVVFQDYKVLYERTVRENVEVALAVIGVKPDEWQTKVDKVLALVGLSERANLFPAQLSGGELQRVSLARALVVNPKVILADEPTGNLDWETANSIAELLLEINKSGKTVIVATHHELLVKKLKKRVIEIKKGRVVSK